MKGSQFDLLQKYVAEVEMTVKRASTSGKINTKDIEMACAEIDRVRKLTAHIDSQIKGLGRRIERAAPDTFFEEDDVELRKTA